MTLQRWTMSDQHWNNVLYVKVNVEPHRIKFVYLNDDMNVTQRQNNVIIFDVEFHSFDQRRKNVEYDYFQNVEKSKKIFLSIKKKKRWLLDNTCFWLWLIKKKGKYGMYNIKVNFGKYNAWYTKRIWI